MLDYSPNEILWRDLVLVHKRMAVVVRSAERLSTIWRLAGGGLDADSLQAHAWVFPRMPARVERVLAGQYRPSTDSRAIVAALGPDFFEDIFDAIKGLHEMRRICREKHGDSCRFAILNMWEDADELELALGDMEDLYKGK